MNNTFNPWTAYQEFTEWLQSEVLDDWFGITKVRTLEKELARIVSAQAAHPAKRRYVEARVFPATAGRPGWSGGYNVYPDPIPKLEWVFAAMGWETTLSKLAEVLRATKLASSPIKEQVRAGVYAFLATRLKTHPGTPLATAVNSAKRSYQGQIDLMMRVKAEVEQEDLGWIRPEWDQLVQELGGLDLHTQFSDDAGVRASGCDGLHTLISARETACPELRKFLAVCYR